MRKFLAVIFAIQTCIYHKLLYMSIHYPNYPKCKKDIAASTHQTLGQVSTRANERHTVQASFVDGEVTSCSNRETKQWSHAEHKHLKIASLTYTPISLRPCDTPVDRRGEAYTWNRITPVGSPSPSRPLLSVLLYTHTSQPYPSP